METKRSHTEGRTILIGDVHGCLDELRALLSKLAPTSADRIILLGDLINRGPDPVGTVRYVAEHDFECLMGNHEHEYLRHRLTEEKYRNLYEALGPDLHRWIKARPLYIEDEHFLAVHAGLQPGRHPRDTRPGLLLNIRTWDGSGGDLSDPANPPWYEFYHERRPVFYGHWARQGLNLRENTIGLDSGCVYGRYLSAYVLESGELVQIPAGRVYYVPPALRTQGQTG
jgi:bis(5'-nucleosyl)-tetraphosphatase (symmetrical)